MSRVENLYATVAAFRRRFVDGNAFDAPDVTELMEVLATASRRADDDCHRHFYAVEGTRRLHGTGRPYMRIPDLLRVDSIKLDEDGDRVYELELASTDYYLEREFHTDIDAKPWTILRLDPNGQRSVFGCSQRLVQIAGLWGYTDATEPVGGTATIADATTTAMTTSVADVVELGDTLLIEDEQVFVRAGSGTSWTVGRGMNGTTPAAHATAAIARYVYVPEVRDAVLITAGRLWKRKDTAYANVIANPVVGQFETFRMFDPDVQKMLTYYVRGEALA